jgi:hypothetical protein
MLVHSTPSPWVIYSVGERYVALRFYPCAYPHESEGTERRYEFLRADGSVSASRVMFATLRAASAAIANAAISNASAKGM